MSVPVTLTLSNFPPGYCWPGAQQYGTDLIALLGGTIPDIVGVVLGDTDPGADYHDGQWLWIKTNSGVPVGHFVYSGTWIWPHPEAPSTAKRSLWVGTEDELKTLDGGVDEAITATTGPFWAVDHNYDGRFPVGIGTIPGAGATVVADSSATGGEDQHTMAETNLPLLDPRIELISAGVSKTWVGSHGGGATVAGVSIDAAFPTSTDGQVRLENEANSNSHTYGNATPVAITNLPPYRGIFFIKRTARQFITG